MTGDATPTILGGKTPALTGAQTPTVVSSDSYGFSGPAPSVTERQPTQTQVPSSVATSSLRTETLRSRTLSQPTETATASERSRTKPRPPPPEFTYEPTELEPPVPEAAILAIWAVWYILQRMTKSEAREKSLPTITEESTSPHLVLTNASPCGPPGVSSRSDNVEPVEFDSGICHGSWFCVHKPTYEPDRMQSGKYPLAEHLHQRKRLWEWRLQLRFRDCVSADSVYFGCEQDRYYHVGTVERYISSSVISLLRHASADNMYQTHGEDPASVRGEAERPTIAFPLWVMDQLIITEEGEEAPKLDDPDFSTYGIIRAQNRKGMQEALHGLEFKPGRTFTFGFWCIAQFVDAIGWRVPARGVIPEVKLNEIGTHPPIYVTMYLLRPQDQWTDVQGRRDTRHLDSRKIYIWRVSLWSSALPPPLERQKDLQGAAFARRRLSSGDGASVEAIRVPLLCVPSHLLAARGEDRGLNGRRLLQFPRQIPSDGRTFGDPAVALCHARISQVERSAEEVADFLRQQEDDRATFQRISKHFKLATQKIRQLVEDHEDLFAVEKDQVVLKDQRRKEALRCLVKQLVSSEMQKMEIDPEKAMECIWSAAHFAIKATPSEVKKVFDKVSQSVLRSKQTVPRGAYPANMPLALACIIDRAVYLARRLSQGAITAIERALGPSLYNILLSRWQLGRVRGSQFLANLFLAWERLGYFEDKHLETCKKHLLVLLAFVRAEGVPDPPHKDEGTGWYKVVAREPGEDKNTEPIASRQRLQALEQTRAQAEKQRVTVTADASEASEKAQAQSFQEAPERGKADVEEAPEVMMVNWLV
ncbi:unnamed protein product [Cladocopium goreaui]|uniref:Zinc finger protein 36, C3H1 type-like 1 n=1 Tax=Cladocopium goreaui TaxID=2562237 RepID=A0A9P1GSG2_9DINO|nr:unnamed protein product [Cladocopium goreaui]